MTPTTNIQPLDSEDYDYIFTGTGCAALSLLMRLISSGMLIGKKVLLIDKSTKTENDRTWCFWEKGRGYFEPVVCHSWSRLNIYGPGYSETHTLDPYRYKMIRGIDFYNHCLPIITADAAITIIHEEVLSVANKNAKATVKTASGEFTATYIFNSILFHKPGPGPRIHSLLQHFKGYLIKTATPSFDPTVGTLMDFRIDQQNGTSFVYVLPLSTSEALVEYTLFSPHLLEQSQYDLALQDYISQMLKINQHKILSTEFGVIPMTNFRFPTHQGNVIYIGTAGGQTKASTGYTFSFIQKQAASIARQLAVGRFPIVPPGFADKKFRWYDSILLDVLANHKLPGSFIFTELFRKNRVTDVFRFLDNESTLWQDLKVIKVLPTGIFARAAVRQATKPPGSAVPHT